MISPEEFEEKLRKIMQWKFPLDMHFSTEIVAYFGRMCYECGMGTKKLNKDLLKQ